MTKQKELVLGGDGLIGSALCTALRASGHEVVSLDLQSGCDLRAVDDRPFFECDRVWFLAWDTGGAKYIEAADRQHEQFKHNAELSLRVFDALSRARKPFVFTSSQLAAVPTAYGSTKAMAANWTLQLGGKVARLWNVYGWEHPSVRSHVITDLALSGLTNGRVECRTHGNERRRFLYKTDCVAAIIKFAETSSQVAEIAGGEWLTIREITQEIARQLDVEAEFGTLEGSEVMIDPKETLADWSPEVTLPAGIELVITDARRYLSNAATL